MGDSVKSFIEGKLKNIQCPQPFAHQTIHPIVGGFRLIMHDFLFINLC